MAKSKAVRETFDAVVATNGWSMVRFTTPLQDYKLLSDKFIPGDRVRVTVERIAKGGKRGQQ
jgi:hypothetical protein